MGISVDGEELSQSSTAASVAVRLNGSGVSRVMGDIGAVFDVSTGDWKDLTIDSAETAIELSLEDAWGFAIDNTTVRCIARAGKLDIDASCR